jgi:hypothetical protein
MKVSRIFGILGIVLVALVTLGVTTHAAAGPMPHDGGGCLACAVCEWLAVMLH